MCIRFNKLSTQRRPARTLRHGQSTRCKPCKAADLGTDSASAAHSEAMPQCNHRHRLALKLACVFAFAWVHRTTECHYNPHRRSILCRHARVLYNCVFLELLMQKGCGEIGTLNVRGNRWCQLFNSCAIIRKLKFWHRLFGRTARCQFLN